MEGEAVSLKILVCDDVDNRAAKWAAALAGVDAGRSVFEVVVPPEDDLVAAIDSLEKRREVARMTSEARPPDLTPEEKRAVATNLFDDVAILVLDYDLFWLGVNRDAEKRSLPTRARLTGEGVAYLVRCYSRCDYIVGLNQFGENTFDLNLRGHLESYADLNIGGVQLGNPGLWGDWVDGFRPSSWPNLLTAAKAQQDRMSFLATRMSSPVLETLNLVDDGYPTVPREALEFLGSDPLALTFEQFAVSGRPRGFDKPDVPWEGEALVRVAASRVAKWLEREVLSGTEALVDRPHLVERFPSVLGATEPDLSMLNKGSYPRENQGTLEHPAVAEAMFAHGSWLSRPAWHWPKLSADSRIDEVADPWSGDAPTFRFCEDVSRFLPEEACLTYSAEVRSSWVTRYVAGPPAISAARQIAPELYDGEFSLAKVTYEPVDVLER